MLQFSLTCSPPICSLLMDLHKYNIILRWLGRNISKRDLKLIIWQCSFAPQLVFWDILLENHPEIIRKNYFILFGTVLSFGYHIFRKTQRNWRELREAMIAQIRTEDKKELINVQESSCRLPIWKSFLQEQWSNIMDYITDCRTL